MFNRVVLFAVLSAVIFCLAGCAGEEPKKDAPAAAPAAAPKAEEEKVPVYELTKDDITTHAGWTSRNISVLGVKIGEKTREVEKNFGNVENTRTLPANPPEPGYYLTIYQSNGLFVYTAQLTGKIRKMEIYDTFAKKIDDVKLKKLMTTGDMKDAKNLAYMRQVLGMEEAEPSENAELAAESGATSATEYSYDSRGFRLVQIRFKGKTLNVLRFVELKKST